MNYSSQHKESVLPLGMKLSQIVSRNSSNNIHYSSCNDNLSFENGQNVEGSNFSCMDNDIPIKRNDKQCNMKRITRSLSPIRDGKNSHVSKTYTDMVKNMKQKSSITQKFLCGSLNKTRVTKKSCAYREFHALKKVKPHVVPYYENFMRLYGMNEQSNGVLHDDQIQNHEESFYFSPNTENSLLCFPSPVVNNGEHMSPEVSDYCMESLMDCHSELNFKYPNAPFNSYKEQLQCKRRSPCSDSPTNNTRVPSAEDLFLYQSGMKTSANPKINYGKEFLYSPNDLMNGSDRWLGEMFQTPFYSPVSEISSPSAEFCELHYSSDSKKIKCNNPKLNVGERENLQLNCIPKEKLFNPLISFPEKNGNIIVEELE